MVSAHMAKAKTHFFKNTDLRQVLHPASTDGAFGFTKTKVAITIGSGSRQVDTLVNLLEAGATCARIDLKWNSLAYHRESLRNLQEAMKRTRRLCAIMLDVQGREITVIRPEVHMDNDGTHREPDATEIPAGSIVTLTTDTNVKFSATEFPISYAGFPAMVQPGDSIFIGRYLVSGADASSLYLRVEDADETTVTCTAQSTGVLSGLLTVFHTERSPEGLSNLQNDLDVLTAYDREAVKTLAGEFDVDFLTLSYCRSADDVDQARQFLSSIGSKSTRVIAKCETRQSLFNFRSIATAADGVVISRGNLGLDVPVEKMAQTQKAMVSVCLALNKPCLITRVVDTMIQTPRPTRAEATDIANAVLDGVDGFLLGAETYRGKYALDAVTVVSAISHEAEAAFDHDAHFDHLLAQAQHLANEGEAGLSPLLRGYAGADMPRAPSASSFASESAGTHAAGLAAAAAAGAGGVHRVGSALGSEAAEARLTKLEAVASSAVRAADKVRAGLVIVVTQTGLTAGLVAKYRPAMPIMTLVVPYLKREGLHWRLEGKSSARQALLTAGLMPVLAAPTPSAGESLIEEAVVLAAQQGIVGPGDHVVTISRSGDQGYMIKVVTVNATASGIEHIRPKSLLNILRGQGIAPELEESEEEAEQAGGPGAALAALAATAGGRLGNGPAPAATDGSAFAAPAADGAGVGAANAAAIAAANAAAPEATPNGTAPAPTRSPSSEVGLLRTMRSLTRPSMVLAGHRNEALVLHGARSGGADGDARGDA